MSAVNIGVPVGAPGIDAMRAFFETPLEPCLKAPFMRRSSGGAENELVVLRFPSDPVASLGGAGASRAFTVRLIASLTPMLKPVLAPVLALLLTMALAVIAAPAWAGRKGDHDRARAAVLAGEVLPLPTLLERLQRTHPGKVLELELEFEDVTDERAAGRKPGRWVYEVKLLQADGQLLKLELDAATAEVLKSRRERGRSDRQRGRDHPESPPAKGAKDAKDAKEGPR
jgi:uncharacterized membrane protein YkoI